MGLTKSSPRIGQGPLLVVAAACLASVVMAQEIVPGRTALRPDGTLDQPAAAAAPAPGDQRVSVLVHLAPGADRGPVRAFAANRGGFVKYEYKLLPNTLNLRGIPQPSLQALAGIPGVVRIEEDKKAEAHMNDSTPLIRALQNQITGAGFTADGAGVRVCIIDTGIDSDHVMYADRIDTAAGRDFVNDDNDPEDDNGHGSHVAGTALGGTGLSVDFGCVGSEPFQGIAPEATLIGVKVLSASGSGSFSDVIAGIDYCADQTASGGRADVINMSLGGGEFTGTCDGDSAAAAANAAVDNGVVVAASSGNDDFDNAMGTPACGSKVIAVGATYDDDYPNCEFPDLDSFTFCTRVCGFVCCGSCTDNSPTVDQIGCYSNASDELDVTAPGCVTFSADADNSPNGIVGFCGTSMASPHVAGLAALLLSQDSSLTPSDVRTAIRGGAIDLGPAGFDREYGHGRIDAINSLSLLGPGCSSDADCDDGDACNGAETCVGGTCESGTPVNCDDSDACTADACDPATGTCSNDPISCDDGDACTVDSCDPTNGCSNDPINCDDGDPCTADSCDSATGTCVNDPISPCCGDGLCETGEDQCSCSADCGTPPATETNCGDGVDEDCDGATDCNDSDCDGDPNCPTGGVCGDGVCDGNGEDCFSCPGDCRCGGGGSCRACCGDGACAGPGENANNCPVDCG